jgi:hypothetical protein
VARAGTLGAVAVVALAAVGACVVPPFDPTGKACALPDHRCPDGFDCVQGRCALATERFEVTAPPTGTVLAGTCGTAELAVRLLDGGLPGSDVAVALQAAGGMRLFLDTRCAQEAPRVTVPSGAPDASFSFFALRGGRYSIFASAGGDTAEIDQDIAPMARSGRCALVNGQSQVACPVVPPVMDSSRAFAVFQTATQESFPSDAGVRCSLTGPGTLRCDRAEGAGQVDVQWQVAEVPGASVQSASTPDGCVLGGTYYFTLPATVDSARSFLLFSERRPGQNFGNDDFSTAQLYDPSTVVVENSAGCNLLAAFAVQVVSLPGASVLRGTADPMDAGVATVDVTGLEAAAPDRTLLLHTHRYGGSATGPGCAKVVRGQPQDAAATSLRFSRGVPPVWPGCVGANLDVTAIAWERIQVPPGDRLQRFVVDLASSQAETTVPISAVDPTRALVLAGGQGNAGQGLGETADSASLDPRAATIALELEPAGTSFRASRASAGGAGRWTVYVWEFGPSP